MNLLEEFIEYLYSHIGDAYVWGAQGQKLSGMTEQEMMKFVQKKETSETNINRALNFISKSTKNPLYAFDCSGLIMYFFQNLKKLSNDESSKGLYAKCKKLNKNQLKQGDFVFRHNGLKIYHVGVYVGNNQVIECMGRDAGVVCRDINASNTSYWNRFGRHPLLQAYIEGDVSDDVANEPYIASCSGDSVNVRSGRGTQYDKLGVLRKNDLILALPPVSDWCEIACCINGKIVTGYMSAKYVGKLQLQ